MLIQICDKSIDNMDKHHAEWSNALPDLVDQNMWTPGGTIGLQHDRVELMISLLCLTVFKAILP